MMGVNSGWQSGEPNWGGFTPPPPPPLSAPMPPARRRARLAFTASLLTTAVVAGGLGATIALLVAHSGTPAVKTVGNTAGGTSPATGTAGLNIDKIAARVDEATVDLSAVGPELGQDAGTGMVISASGMVLTNNHVIEGSTQIGAQVNGAGPTYSASVLGTDLSADVALLQLHGAKTWKTVTIGRSSSVFVGDPVVAVGNALDLPGPETVTSGIISAVGRAVTINDPLDGTDEQLTGLFQTSAALSSGNSGGPLVNAQGEVIGITTGTASSEGPGETASDVGFAIPIWTAITIARQIDAGKASATVHIGSPAATGLALISVACADGLGCLPLGFGDFGEEPFGDLGIYQAPINEGAVVAGIDRSCPVASSGLRVGDVITDFNGHGVTSPDQVAALVDALKVGDQVHVSWVSQNDAHHSARFQLVQGPNL